MEFSFKSGKLRKQLESNKEMRKAFGDNRAKPLQRRLTELRKATSLDHVERSPPPRCHELQGQDAGVFSVDVTENYRLLFQPDPFVTGHVDWAKVVKIKILGVKDTHKR